MKPSPLKSTALAVSFLAATLSFASAQAAMTKDANGNVGYDTLAECETAVNAGTAKFYQPFTSHPPLQRTGEASVKVMALKDLVAATEAASALGYNAAGYTKGSCDLGVGRSQGRDGVSPALIGKYVPYSPEMAVNAYMDASGKIVRASMKQCDNNFAQNLPRPLGGSVSASVPSECYATVVVPAKFETRSEQVVKVPATKRVEVIPATYKTLTEQELVSPPTVRQIPVAATYKDVTEDVVVRPASQREEPVPATYKNVTEQIEVKAASKRIEVIAPTYKTVTERVLAAPERKVVTVVPAVYGEKSETVPDRAATTRVETTPATYKMVTEQVVSRPEMIMYEPIAIPTKMVSEQVLSSPAGKRLEAVPATFRTVTERVQLKEASKRLVEVPAQYETITERVKVAEASAEWKRGKNYISQALAVRPVQGFTVGADGKVDGRSVAAGTFLPGSAITTTTGVGVSGAAALGVLTPSGNLAGNVKVEKLDDDVMCLVPIPERYETVTRQVIKYQATVREEMIPAEFGLVSKQVMVTPATTREIDVPAAYQTVTRTVIDTDRMKTLGYKFDAAGHITNAPNGDRVLRASEVNARAAAATGGAAGAAPAGAGAANAAGIASNATSGFEGYVREFKVPAQTSTVTRQVLDKPATARVVEVPATTKTIKVQTIVTPATTREEVIPAVFQTVTRQVVDKPASTREIAIPAEFKTVTRQVEDKPATVRFVPVPAVTQKVTRKVVDQAATYREEMVPAVYRTVSRQVIDRPATTREIDVPAQFETINSQIKVADAVTLRRAILCEANATPSKIREIQTALRTAGHNPGAVDGRLTANTMRAVEAYQKAKNLPQDGFLNLETVKALGVSAN